MDSTSTTEPEPEPEGQTIEFTEPEPTTPPVPFSDLPHSPQDGLTLHLPRRAPHIASAQPSPTAFFDSFEAQPNALDELESSDEETEDESDQVNEMQARTKAHPPPSFRGHASAPRSRVNSTASAPVPRSPLGMKFTNNSVPAVSSTRSPAPHPLPLPLPLPVGSGGIGSQANLKPRRPVGNDPKQRSMFFADRSRSDGETTLDFYRLKRPGTSSSAQNSNSSTSSLASGILNVGLIAGGLGGGPMGGSGASLTPGTTARASEETRLSMDPGRPSFAGTVSSVATSAASVRSEEVMKLDGMLREHMEAEKEKIRKIATGLKAAGNKSSAGSTPTITVAAPSESGHEQTSLPSVTVTQEPEDVEVEPTGAS